jgi:glycine/D-amino acid oxidase-like deaminating enzyme
MAKSKDVVSSSERTPFPRRPIVILGAGIIGCATALQLLQNGFRVILVAEFHPGDRDIRYASAWAGAAWHAAGGLSDEHKYLQVVSHRQLLKLAREEPESGVCIVNSLEYVEEEPPENSALWAQTVLQNVSGSLRSLCEDGGYEMLIVYPLS